MSNKKYTDMLREELLEVVTKKGMKVNSKTTKKAMLEWLTANDKPSKKAPSEKVTSKAASGENKKPRTGTKKNTTKKGVTKVPANEVPVSETPVSETPVKQVEKPTPRRMNRPGEH
jgi:hypothetical protein